MLLILSLLSCGIWLFLLGFWGNFWRCDQRLESAPPSIIPPQSGLPRVIAVIPARNEAEVIGMALGSLVQQTYPNLQGLILVDDQSTDGTASVAQAAVAAPSATAPSAMAQLTLLPGYPLPPGWSGKLWALHQGIAKAQEASPDYLWLTDADICHAPESLAQLVAKAESEQLALVSLMVRLRCQSVWERRLIPAFIFFFQKLYPFPWVNNSRRRLAGAAGGCILIRRDVLEEMGGIEVVRTALIDDCALAAAVKGSKDADGKPRKIWLGFGPQSCDRQTYSLRPYDSLASIWSMVARTAYTQLHYSPLLLVGTLVGMALVYLVAPVGMAIALIAGLLQPSLTLGLILGINALTWILIAIAYGPTLRLYGQPWIAGFGLPAVAGLYTLMTLDSARRHWQGQGGAWKGRTY